MTTRYEARGRFVMVDGEPIGMFLDESSASLAAAGMNAIQGGSLRSTANVREQLQPRRDFAPPQEWPTQHFPQIPS